MLKRVPNTDNQTLTFMPRHAELVLYNDGNELIEGEPHDRRQEFLKSGVLLL